MNEQEMMAMMMSGQGGMPQQQAPQKEEVSVSSLLSDYRKAYGLVRKDAEQKNEGSIWSPMREDAIPTGEVGPAWGSRMEMPEELPDFRDDRNSGDPVINEQEYNAYMESHPFIQRDGGKLEELVQELAKMAKDPKNAMTLEEAQGLFMTYATDMYRTWEQGGEYTDKRKKNKKGAK